MAFSGLQVAAGHVEADGVAEDAVERRPGGNVAAAAGQRHHQLDLVLQVGRARRIVHAFADQDGLGRLHEEERRLALRIAAHLAGMFGIVAADAVDAPHRESRLAAGDRHGGLGPGGDDHIQGWGS